MNKQNTFEYLKSAGLLFGSPNFPVGGVIPPPGNIFFVDSGHADAADDVATDQGGSWSKPYATLDYAIGKCTASNGDIILLAPGHAENIASATGCVLDVAGVTIIGIGGGSLIPTLSLTTAATATISITAANCAIKNVRLVSNYTGGITAGITVAATADGLLLEDLQVGETANTKEFLTGITLAANADNVTIDRLEYINTGSTDSLAAITLAGAADRFRLLNSKIIGNFETATIHASTAAGTNIVIADNCMNNPDATAGLNISLHASTTGIVVRNLIFGGKDTVHIAAAGCLVAENYSSNAAGASGLIKPTVDS